MQGLISLSLNTKMTQRAVFFFFFVLLLFAANPLTAADVIKDAEVFFKTRLDAVINILRNKDTDREIRKQQVTDIIMPVFDFELMAKLALGKENWSTMTSAQKKRYNELFVARLKTSYLDTMLQYTDEKINYKPAILQGGKVHIPTELVSKNSVYAMVYKLYQTGGAWKIYDVEIEGVSIIKSYRTQFDSILGTGSVEDLLKKMEEPEEKK